MTQKFVTLPREAVERALEAFDVATTPLARDRQEVLRAQAALRAALEQPQVKQEQASTNTWSTADGIRCLHCHLPLSSHSEQRYCQRVEDGSQANQPAMTPIAQRKLEDLVASGYTISGYSIYHEQRHQHGFVTGAGLVGWWKPENMEYPQPQVEHEPYLWYDAERDRLWNQEDAKYMDMSGTIPLYTHQQPKREPLTDAEIGQAVRWLYQDHRAAEMGLEDDIAVARAIEAAHNIK